MSLAFHPPSVNEQRPESRAVFLHTSWRSAGTWIWSEFRAHAGAMAFYEPLHEELAALSLSRLAETNASSWESGHPHTAPYFVEFAPLMRGSRRGVAGYDRSFAFGGYFLDERDDHPKLRAYIERLHNVAYSSGRQPVFKFCRSLGRVGWMKRHFPHASHIAVVRDPLVQWESAWRLAERGSTYFLSLPAALLARNAGVPLVDAIVAAFDLRLGHLRHSSEAQLRERCDAFTMQSTMAMTYRISLAFWLLTGLTSIAKSDFSIDSDELSSSTAYRTSMQAKILSATGVPVNFSSARSPRASALMPASRADVDRLHELARAFATAHGAPELLRAKL